MVKESNPNAVALAKKRWEHVSEKKRKEHSQMMNRAPRKKISTGTTLRKETD